MKLFYEARAFDDLERIESRIAQDSPRSANRVVEAIIKSIDRLTIFPDFGRTGTVPGTREVVIGGLPYIVIYRVDAEREIVVVLAVFHTAQDRTETPTS